MYKSKNILIAPLNWGLGHAARCIPIIQELLASNYNPIIASDGKALQLLKKEFPQLQFIKLPSYDIKYVVDGKFLKLKLLLDAPKIWSAINNENHLLSKLVPQYQIDLVISDNRMGMFTSQVPCIFMTHQLQVLSGSTTWISTLIHKYYIKKFTYCWVPDVDAPLNLSGILSRNNDPKIKKSWIGPLSRLIYNPSETTKYDLLVLLSGPEPQRSILEKQLLEKIHGFKGSILFVAGNIEKEQKVTKKGKLTYYNFLTTSGLQKAFERSNIILSRSGYSTIMDVQKMRKKAFFIPTPGQFEQIYLAQHLQDKKIAPFSNQEDFTFDQLERVNDFIGFKAIEHQSTTTSISEMLECVFSSVKENSDPIPSSLST
jgi:uncharacterized protein (TIGR00661 family)